MRRGDAIVRLASAGPLASRVHGGGRTIDAELRARGQSPRFVDGLRVTGDAALERRVCASQPDRTPRVAAPRLEGLAVGSAPTGASGCRGGHRSSRASPGWLRPRAVGEPVGTTRRCWCSWSRRAAFRRRHRRRSRRRAAERQRRRAGGALRGILPARRLIIAGGTAGVLDGESRTVAELPVEAIDALTSAGVAHSGMIAKLQACRRAFASGVTDVSIVAGRGAADYESAVGTRLVASRVSASSPAEIRA